MSATIKDVAKKAGVAVGTVSRYLNGYAVTDHNRMKVERAINELGYKANPVAKSLRTNKSMTVAVVVPSLANIFSMSIIESIERYLDTFGYSVIVCDTRGNRDTEREKLEFVKNKYIDGIVIMPTDTCGSHILDAVGDEIPVVLIDRLAEGLEADAVVLDNTNAVYNAVEHLIVKGHRRIGIIAGPQNIYTGLQRLEGYRRCLIDYDVPVSDELICEGDYTSSTGYCSMKRLANIAKPPTAVFVSNYEMSIGAIEYINEAGIRIPDDLSIIVFDQLELSKVVSPPLAIVSQPKEDIGTKAATLLYRRMTGDQSGFPILVRLKAEFFKGQSVKAL